MNNSQELELMLATRPAYGELTTSDPCANPFRTVIDPAMRFRLKKALVDLIDNHDRSLENYVSNGQLSLESYKEYIELFARCLRETMETREGVSYLLRSSGFEVSPEDVNLYPDWRWNEDSEPS